MKNVKLDDKSKFMYAVIFAVIILVAGFLFGYKKLEDKANSLNNQNADLESRIASLETYYLTEEQNKKDTETMTQAIVDVFDDYAGDCRADDGIYEARNLITASGNTMEVDVINLAGNVVIKEIPLETVAAAQIEGFDQTIDFQRFDVTYDGRITYDGLKSMVDEIANGEYNLAIGNMSYFIGVDGYIHGKSLLSFYSVTGANCPYEQPPVFDYEVGLENLFGVSGSVSEDIVTED